MWEASTVRTRVTSQKNTSGLTVDVRNENTQATNRNLWVATQNLYRAREDYARRPTVNPPREVAAGE